jgi:hypothetical protein
MVLWGMVVSSLGEDRNDDEDNDDDVLVVVAAVAAAVPVLVSRMMIRRTTPMTWRETWVSSMQKRMVMQSWRKTKQKEEEDSIELVMLRDVSVVTTYSDSLPPLPSPPSGPSR